MHKAEPERVERYKKLLDEAGITGKEIAAGLNIAPSTYSMQLKRGTLFRKEFELNELLKKLFTAKANDIRESIGLKRLELTFDTLPVLAGYNVESTGQTGEAARKREREAIKELQRLDRIRRDLRSVITEHLGPKDEHTKAEIMEVAKEDALLERATSDELLRALFLLRYDIERRESEERHKRSEQNPYEWRATAFGE